MKQFKMELMDWKQLERSSEDQYRTSLVNSMLASIMNELAVITITVLR